MNKEFGKMIDYFTFLLSYLCTVIYRNQLSFVLTPIILLDHTKVAPLMFSNFNK